jgi:hypothetical protein
MATDFSGVTACTSWVNSSIDSARSDSMFGCISYEKDTVLMRVDSVYGDPSYNVTDILSWRTVRFHFRENTTIMMRKVLLTMVDSAVFPEVKHYFDTVGDIEVRPTEAVSAAVVNALNKAMHDVRFYHDNRDSLLPRMSLDFFKGRINRLIREGIFLDSTGDVKPVLNAYERAVVRWFNTELLSYPAFDIPPSVIGVTVLQPLLSSERLLRFRFALGKSPGAPDDRVCNRLFAFSRNGEKQIEFSHRSSLGGVYADRPAENMMIPFPTSSGTSWNVTPLFWQGIPMIPDGSIKDLVLPGRGIVMYKQELSNPMEACFDYNLYYPVNGCLSSGAGSSFFIGHIAINFQFRRNLWLTTTNQARLDKWNTELFIQKTGADGRVTVRKEKTSLKAAATEP